MANLFEKSDILIPREDIDMSKWSVIACDQHTSELDYWDKLERYIGDAPSTLRMMLPEAYLDRNIGMDSIYSNMQKYLSSNVFRTISDSYIYVERKLSNGKVRRGLVGALNLKGDLLTTEAVVPSRLPPRIEIRKAAPLEMPHVMIFTNEPVFSTVKTYEKLYDFDLNCSGGHIIGFRCDADTSVIHQLAIGDGNHSIAAAKACGDEYALVELVDINDDAIDFQPIHRVVFDTDTSFLKEKIMYMNNVSDAENFCKEYAVSHGGYIDYIHNDETALEMGQRENCFAVILPPFNKSNLFSDIVKNGPYPKKSFSIGHAEDKRYYLECRKIND